MYARAIGYIFGLSAVLLSSTVVAVAEDTVVVTQRGRAFQPASVEIKVGDRVRVINDDGDLLHHAYVDDANLKFDSGEQEPGTSLEIAFPTAGTFDVLCGIHPKMRLVVTVR
jgi:plastocyanin